MGERGTETKLPDTSSSNSLENAVSQTERHHDRVMERDATPLTRALRGRHLQMIAIGGSIGAGLFIGSGKALSDGGPASVLLGFLIIGVMVFCAMQSLGELSVLYPVNGAFYNYATRFVDPAWGFTMGWQYTIGWLTLLPSELVAAGITIQFWRDDIRIGVWIAVFLVLLSSIQFFGVRGYGETEFALSLIKIIACIGLIFLGIITNAGGVPTDDRGYIGGRYWRDPGAFRNGFKGFSSVFVTAAFAYAGTEMVGLAAAETVNPAKSIPKASKQVFWRILIFYIINILLLGLNVPSDSEVLLGAVGPNSKASPFVLAVQLAGIKVLPHIINAVITISVLSVGNTATYGSTRTLQALAIAGQAPKIFAYVDSKGRPLTCVALQIAFGFLAFVSEASSGDAFFTWMLATGGLAVLFMYGSICLSHIQFRRAWRMQGKELSEIPWRSPLGVCGSWVGLFIVCVSLVASFYVALFPINSEPSAKGFFAGYLAAFIACFFFVFWKIYSWDFSIGVDLKKVDLERGRRPLASIELDELKRELSWHQKVWGLLF
ncbi:hypothetical protein FQN55_006574 [Onygenales sp. PD_40]|nr:hypothetical protein FQN55_006574 [Onygenales sp. PD_40]